MTQSNRLADVRSRVEAGQRLSFDDGVYLSEEVDLNTLGDLANLVRERKNGHFAYYIGYGGALKPAYGEALSVTERWDIVNHLRTLAQK